MVGDHRSPTVDFDPVKSSTDVDYAADPGGVDGVVAGIETDVVVVPEPDQGPPTQLQREREQRQHNRQVPSDQVDRCCLDGAHDSPVR